MKRVFSTTINPEAVNLGLLLLRVGLGAMLLTHGWPKLQMILSGNMQFADPIGIGAEASLYLATFAEFACAILVMLGLASRLAALAVVVNFAVAVFIAHAGQPFGDREMPALFLLGFTSLLITGPGRYSIDALFTREETVHRAPRARSATRKTPEIIVVESAPTVEVVEVKPERTRRTPSATKKTDTSDTKTRTGNNRRRQSS